MTPIRPDRRPGTRPALTAALALLTLAGCGDAPRTGATPRFEALTRGTPDELWARIEALNKALEATEAEDPDQVRVNLRAYADALVPTAEALIADRSTPEETRYQATDKLLTTFSGQIGSDPAAMRRFLDVADRLRDRERGSKIATMIDHTVVKVLREAPPDALPDELQRFDRIADATLRLGRAEPAPPDTPKQLVDTGRYAAGLGQNRRARELFDLLAKRYPFDENAGLAAGAAHRFGLEGKPVGEFRGPSLDGKSTIDLADFRGKVVLIDFWASWSAPSIKEVPELKALRDRLAPRGFEILGVSLDPYPDHARQFVRAQKIPWPAMVMKPTPGALHPELAARFGVDAIPMVMLVDRDGTLVTSSNVLARVVPEIEKRLPPPDKAD